ncbi:MAG: MlaD family protein, partial [Candidatus Omnitrophota bacterium]|nr:MlaD family protein [Candidatus Omnitrophota bacterium]
MIRKANKTLIGAFVVGALALFIIAITVFGSGMMFKRADKYVLYFNGSVKGLSVGAPVIFRGVKIGNISDINLFYDDKDNEVLIMVVIDVELERVKGIPDKIGYPDYNALVKRGLKAKLEIQNFITGQLMLAFDFYADKPVKIYDVINAYPQLPTLPISPDIFEIMNEIPIKEISANLEQTASGLNKLVNSEGILELDSTLREATSAARSIRLFMEYLEQHPEALLKGKSVNQ